MRIFGPDKGWGSGMYYWMNLAMYLHVIPDKRGGTLAIFMCIWMNPRKFMYYGYTKGSIRSHSIQTMDVTINMKMVHGRWYGPRPCN